MTISPIKSMVLFCSTTCCFRNEEDETPLAGSNTPRDRSNTPRDHIFEDLSQNIGHATPPQQKTMSQTKRE